MVAVNPTALDLIGEVVTNAGAAVAANLPGAPTPDVVREGWEGLAFGPGGKAVAARLAGAAAGTVVVALAEPLAAALEDGPLGAQDLVAALQTVLADALAALEPTFGSPLELEAPFAIEADLALSSLDGVVVSVPMHADGTLAAAFVVAVDVDSDEAADGAGDGAAPGSMDLPSLDMQSAPKRPVEADPAALELLADVEMGVTAELGRTRMTVRNLLALTPGSVVELDRVAGSAVDLLVNGTLIARGEVVVIDDEFGVRVTEIVGRQNSEKRRK